MKIVLTNDDGIDAPGLDKLFQIVRKIGDPVVVAPQAGQSGVGHRVTTHSPIPVEHLGHNRYSVGGSPADCVRVALKHFAPDAGWLIAGINPGANLGSDVYQSGTVAATREAAILGYPGIAISQYIAKDQQVDWEITGHHAQAILKVLLAKKLPAGNYWNVNLPHPLEYDSAPEYVFCETDKNPHKYSYHRNGNDFVYQGTIHERPRDPGKDVAVCFGGDIAITQLMI